MAEYETIYVLKPDLSEASVETLREKFVRQVEENGGRLKAHEVWGRRRLAYPISGEREGLYVRMVYEMNADNGPAAALRRLEETLRISEGVLRFLSVKLPPPSRRAPPEKSASPEAETAPSPEKPDRTEAEG